MKLTDAIQGQILDHFSLKSSDQSGKSTYILGKVSSIREGHIYIDIEFQNEKILDEIKINCSKDKYDIIFHNNRTPFIRQHTALKIMKEDGVFNTLINDKLYKVGFGKPPQSYHGNHKFW